MEDRTDATRGEDQVEDFRWANLVAYVLHPADVQILEAFARIGKPLTAENLYNVLGGKPGTVSIQFRLRRLHKYKALEIHGAPTRRHSFDIPYRLAALPNDGR